MFPLPLTCLEEYMYHDDSPGFPMTGVFRLRFSGKLDRAAIADSLADAVGRHPLLRSTVRQGRRGRLAWVDNPDWQPVWDWDAAVNRFGFPEAPYSDLTQVPGTRVWGVPDSAGDQLVLQVHHACTDALGMNQVIADLLLGYAFRLKHGSRQGALAALPPIDLQRLARRGAPDATAWKLLRMSHKQVYGLLGAREFLTRKPTPLTEAGGDIDRVTPPPSFPCPLIGDLDVDETNGLLTAARSLRVTVNDLLLRDFFLAVVAWRRRQGAGSDEQWLRFSVPMNLRGADGERMPMANSISSVFIDRRGADVADPDRLLRGIHEQMALIKRLQLQYTFVLSLGVARWLPGGIARSTRSDRYPITCWMSNLGPVLGGVSLPRADDRILVGNVELSGVDYVIPLRPQMHAATVAHTYAGRLQLLISTDPRTISEHAGRQLLDLYCQQVKQTAKRVESSRADRVMP